MPYNDYPFMSVDTSYYQELVKKADLYKEVLRENQRLKQKINHLMNENHLLKQKIQDSILRQKSKRR